MAGHSKMARGDYEIPETDLLRRLLGRVDAFVDVGANVGYYTLLARHLNRPVLAVEPSTANLRFLLANLARNGFDDVEVFACGLGERTGLIELWGVADGASTDRNWKGAASPFSEVVPQTTLDRLLAGQFEGASLLVKIDVEGAEYPALVGARETVARAAPPIFFVETHLTRPRVEETNPDFRRVFELFFDNSYRAAEARAGGKEITPEILDSWLEGSARPAATNYLFWKGDRAIADLVGF